MSAACEALRYRPDEIIVIPGEEDASSLLHLVCLNVPGFEGAGLVQDMQGRIDDISAAGGLAIIAHPSTLGFYSQPETRALKNYTGMEINSAQDLAQWDALLAERISQGEPLLWGFLSNDTNNEAEFADGLLMLRSPALSLESVVASLKQGSFYWSTGLSIADIGVSGQKITVRLNEKAGIRFIASGGRVVQETSGTTGSYEAAGDEGYVRVEIDSASGKMAGTQPFRVQNGTVFNPYATGGTWYRGNLHTHSTGEGGPAPREEVVKLYRQNGYDFIAVTDAVPWYYSAGSMV